MKNHVAALFASLTIASSPWTQCETAQLTCPDAAANHKFGDGLDVYGDLCVTGGSGVDAGAQDAGGACVWTRIAGTWIHAQTLQSPSPTPGGHMGVCVAIFGDIAVISEPQFGAPGGKGVVHIYSVGPGGLTYLTTLAASNGSAGDKFGFHVATDGTWVVVGAFDHGSSGAVYAYRQELAGTWVEYPVVPQGVSSGAEFGVSVGVSNGRIVVGARYDGGTGKAYFFDWTGSAWQQVLATTTSLTGPGYELGTAVAIDGDTAAVAAIQAIDPNNGASGAGGVVVFSRTPGGWAETAVLHSDDAEANDFLGHGLAVTGDRIVAGAHGDDDGGEASGSAYVFRQLSSGWTQVQKLRASNAAQGDSFGDLGSVAAHETTAVIGAPGVDAGVADSGTAYVFDLQELEATCTFQNGTGLNPAEFGCVSTPVVGKTWKASFSGASLTADMTGLAVGGSSPPGSTFSGELLLSAPLVLFQLSNQLCCQEIPIPCNPALVGWQLTAQGFSLSQSGGVPTCTFLNAQNLRLGTY